MPLNHSYMARVLANAVITSVREVAEDEPSVKRGDKIIEGMEIGSALEDFIGQDLAKRQITLAIDSAQHRDVRLDHILLASGIPGIGKTTLARLIAYKFDVGLLECSGPVSVQEAKSLLSRLQDGDILFVDEAHTLGKKADWLLPYMLDGILLTADGPERMPNVTIIAATTDIGKLPPALISRFPVKPQLVNYNPQEAEWIVGEISQHMGVFVDYAHRSSIAKAGNYNPRQIKDIVTIYRDLSFSGDVELDLVFELTGVTEDGLTVNSKDMLVALFGSTNYTASATTLGMMLNESGNIGHIERDLVAKGFLEITGRGRKLTRHGVHRARALL